MKFYFCEGCGKRITDWEIGSGEARDKKLKGVFCTGCAVGVTTMDTLPLTNDDAEKLVREETATETERAARKSTGANRRPKSSSVTRAAGRRGADRQSRLSEPVYRSRNAFPWFIGAAAAVLLVAVTVWFAASSQPSPKMYPYKQDPSTLARDGPTKQVDSTYSSTTPAARTPGATDRGALGEIPSKSTQSEVKSPAENPSSAVGTKDEDSIDAPKSARGRLQLETPKDVKDKNTPVQSSHPEGGSGEHPFPEPNGPEHPTEPAKQKKTADTPDVNRSQEAEAIEHHLDQLRLALKNKDLAAVGSAVDQMSKDIRLGPEHPTVTGAREVIGFLKKRRADRMTALKAKLGQHVSLVLPGSKRRRTVKLVGLKERMLDVQVTYQINNQTRHRSFVVNVDELTNTDWLRIHPTPGPSTARQWIAVGLVAWAQDNKDALAAALKASGAHPLHAGLTRALEKIRLGEREFAASEAWQRAEKLFASESWNEAAESYGTFWEQWQNTDCARHHAAELRERIQALETRFSVYLTDLPHIDSTHKKQGFPFKKNYEKDAQRGLCKKSLRMVATYHGDYFVTFKLDESYALFKARVGNPGQPGKVRAAGTKLGTPITCHVLGDGKELWVSRELSKRGEYASCCVNIEGIKLLKLVIRCQGGAHGIEPSWLDPRLVRIKLPQLPPAKAPRPAPVAESPANGQGDV